VPVATVDPRDPLADRYEGTAFANGCSADGDCHTSGCSAEICSAEAGIASTCEGIPLPGGQCGCVEGQCIWHELVCGGCPDADGDGQCDPADGECNADGRPTECARIPPRCLRGTVPEVRDGCYTDRCVSWGECGGGACRDADRDGRCDAEDSDCSTDGSQLGCRRVAPPCPAGTVPEIRDACYTDVCLSWGECAAAQAPCRADADCAGGGACVEGRCLPAGRCEPVRPGEFGDCRALIGWGVDEGSGACVPVSGCGCDDACAGRVFDTEAACLEACGDAGPECGGIAGRICPRGQMCVDDPSDGCDPANGGADCGGICVDSPPRCGGLLGTPCPDGLECVDDPSDDCDPANGGADCGGLCQEPRVRPCGGIAGLRCDRDEICVDDPNDRCDPANGGRDCIGICAEPGAACGGIAGLRCPRGQSCVDDPRDRCDPAGGGRDCPAVCIAL
jgi:eight-cysteine-cluster-containing protein